MEGHKPSPSLCICSLWQMQILWCAKLEAVLKPPLLTHISDVSCNGVFSEGGGGVWSCEDVLEEGPGAPLATLTRQQLLRVSPSTLCTTVLALPALHLLCTQQLCRDQCLQSLEYSAQGAGTDHGCFSSFILSKAGGQLCLLHPF